METRIIDWESCQRCNGGSVQLKTTAPKDQVHYNDEVECLDCGLKGRTECDEDSAYVSWDEYEEQ